MTALERSQNDLEEAKQKIAIIEKLKAIINRPIESLIMFTDEVRISLDAMSLTEAIKYITSLKLVDTGAFSGRGIKPITKKNMKDGKLLHLTTLPYAIDLTAYTHSIGSEKSELFGFILLGKTVVEVNIPINDFKERLTEFKHSGSTSRSRITGMVIKSTPKPFNSYINWSGIHKAIFYKSAK